MYAIYGNIYHQYTPFMLAYIPYMDPMGYVNGMIPRNLTMKNVPLPDLPPNWRAPGLGSMIGPRAGWENIGTLR